MITKPKNRSKLRICLGTSFYTVKKHIYWCFLDNIFAKQINEELPIEVFKHKTVLRRELSGVSPELQENKIKNLQIAIKGLDTVVIEPGETLSFWKLIGRPTKSKGYLDGMILNRGRVESGVGGGLCQLSNLIYWMTLHTPLSVTERWRHSYDVFPDVKRDQPFGSGATCAYPNIDLQIKNKTNQRFQLKLEVTDEYLVGAWISDKEIDERYEVFEKDHEMKQELFGTYSRNNKIYRLVIDKNADKILREESITENHALMMYNPLIEVSKKS
jgi:vancomycin resistance protein VanW